ncbi:MAG: hypothetical protein ABR512_05435 [Desulfopila sp.]
MKTLSQSQKYSVEEIATELGFSTKLENGIRANFGDPISINDLKLITRRDFTACKYLGMKSWHQFKAGLSVFCSSESAVTFINQPSMDSVIVEIDTSKPFKDVVQGLAIILKNNS